MEKALIHYANAVISNDHNDLQMIHMKFKNIAIYERDILSLLNELNQITDQKMECRANGNVEEMDAINV